MNLCATIFIGGFSSSFSSRDICRFCHIQHLELPYNAHGVGDEAHEPWTVDEYDAIAQSLENEEEVPVHVQTVVTSENLFDEFDEPDPDCESESDDEEQEDGRDQRGLKSVCVLNSLESFHCIHSMPPDCLHDLFEGVIAQDLLGIIRILKNKNWFTIESYNKQLNLFQLSKRESANKPQQVPEGNKATKLSGKAISLWCHLRIFFSLLHRNHWLRDPEDPVLKLASILVDLTNRITAEVFRDHEIERLHDIVLEYLQMREEVLENYPILGSCKPKHHFLGMDLVSTNNFIKMIY